MRKVGNTVSNRIYNPENKKPQIPIDADEADSAMERFIRQKYVHNVARDAGTPRTARAEEDSPPPLPPKNTSKFGFKSAHSLFHPSARKKDTRHAGLTQSTRSAQPAAAGRSNKPSQLFGASIGYDDDDYNKKLARLRDMGFRDAQRNAIVLKGVNGNVERAVEALVRLGENDASPPAPQSAASDPSRPLRASRSAALMNSARAELAVDPGVTRAANPRLAPATPSSTSTNPFDVAPPAQRFTPQSTGALQNNNPYGPPSQYDDAFAQAFQNMNVGPPAPPLFPHHTGGVIGQTRTESPYQHRLAPSAPASPQSPLDAQHLVPQSGLAYPQQQQQQPTRYNPFLSMTSNPAQHPALPPAPAMPAELHQGNFAGFPTTRLPALQAPPSLGQVPEQAQSVFPMQPCPTGTNPYHMDLTPSPVHMNQTQNPYGQVQTGQPWRLDTASIMALYGQPPSMQQPFQPTPVPSISENSTSQPPTSAAMASSAYQHPPTSSLPGGGSKNPFMNSASMASSTANPAQRKVSRDSMTVGADLAWANGRHSPDAFASLSARHA